MISEVMSLRHGAYTLGASMQGDKLLVTVLCGGDGFGSGHGVQIEAGEALALAEFIQEQVHKSLSA